MGEPPSYRRRPGLPNLNLDAGLDPDSTKVRASPATVRVTLRRDRPFLIVIGGASVGEMFAVRQSELIVGRGADAHLRFEDDGVSRRHARLTCAGHEVQIEDLGSANGTFVNGARLSAPQRLADGDKITLGSVTILKFTYSDDLDESFQRRMFDASLRDGLTKAYNKAYFIERLDHELAYARRHAAPLSVILLDIDHFKNVNDTFGHPVGDAVLTHLAKTVMDTLRKEDLFARFGGEEFALLCRGAPPTGTALAERLRALVASMRITHAQTPVVVTASFGVASYPELDAETPMQLVTAADEALYEAKHAGRNRVVFHRRGP